MHLFRTLAPYSAALSAYYGALRETLLLVLVCGCVLSDVKASDLVARDNSFLGVGGSPELGGLELDDRGRAYWWHVGGESRNEGAVEGTIGWLPRTMGVQPQGFAGYYTLRSAPVGGMAVDEWYVYHTTPRGVERRFNDSDPRSKSRWIGRDFGLMPGVYQPGPAVIWRGELFFAMMSDTAILDLVPRGRFLIHAMPIGEFGTEPASYSRVVSDGSAMQDTAHGAVMKIGFVSQPVVGGGEITSGVALMFNGDLLRFSPVASPGVDAAAHRIASGVTDFSIRRENARLPGQFFGEVRDVLYVTLSEALGGRSRLVALDPVTGGIREIYVAEANRRLMAVGNDRTHLFVSERDVSCSSFLGRPLCSLGEGRVRSKTRGDGLRFLTEELPDANWAVVEVGIATHLRSDGKYLFFTRGSEIRRMLSDTPPLVINFQPLGLEAVQAVQDMNHTVPLVEGKPAFVRAYGRVVKDTSGRAGWYPDSELRGRLNGVDLGAIKPTRGAWIDAGGQSNFGVVRSNNDRTFLFELPSNWVRLGALDLTFVINPSGGLPEQGAGVSSDNQISARVSILRSNPVQLVFHTVPAGNYPDYNPGNEGEDFAGTIARALSMLPVTELRVRFHPAAVSGGPYNISDTADQGKALAKLDQMAAMESRIEGGALVHHVGAVDRRIPGFNGLGYRPGWSVLVRMEPGSLGLRGFDTPYGGTTLAHELGHNWGRRHINQSMSSTTVPNEEIPKGPYEPYPYDGRSLGMLVRTNFAELDLPGTPFGFDPIGRTVVMPTAAGDIMSYSASTWMSRETWRAILLQMPANLVPLPGPFLARSRLGGMVEGADPGGAVLMVTGSVDENTGVATIESVLPFPAGAIDRDVVASSYRRALEQNDGLVLRLMDGMGTILDERPLVVEDESEHETPVKRFLQFAPATEAVTTVEITDPTQRIWGSRSSSATGPLAMFTMLPIVDETTGTVRVDFELSDGDGDPVTAVLQFTADDGLTWQVLETDLAGGTMVIETRRLAGGDRCRFRLIASDGFLAGSATTDPFPMAKHAPEIFISGLIDGQVLDHGTEVALAGVGYDAEDGGLSTSSVGWEVRGPSGRSGVGGHLVMSDLAPGNYVAEAMVVDSGGEIGRRVLRFEVRPAIVPDGAGDLQFDGQVGEEVYRGALTLPLSGSGGGIGVVRMVRVGSVLQVGITGLRYGIQETVASVALSINSHGRGGDKLGLGDIRFTVNEQGVTQLSRGGDSGFEVATDIEGGLAASVDRGANTWSVEMRIHEKALGGWNHATRMRIAHDYAPPGNQAGAVWPSSTTGVESPRDWPTVWLGRLAQRTEVGLTAMVQADGMIVLTWPSDGSGCVLESADALGEGGWRAVVPAPVGTSHLVPGGEGSRFYRLRCP